MEGFQPMEVLTTNGRSKILFDDFDPILYPDLVLDVYEYSVKVRIFFELSVYFNCIFCENTADFHKFKYYDKLIAGNNF